jgi:adenylate cyclase
VGGDAGNQSTRLTAEKLAHDTGASRAFIDRLVAERMIRRDADGLHDVGDISRVRLAQAFAEGGMDVDALAWAIEHGVLFGGLDFATELWPPGTLTGRSYGEFAASLGKRASLLPTIYAAFGLAEPVPETPTRHDEEELLTDFLAVWSMITDQPDAMVSAARIAGEGVRRVQSATEDVVEGAEGTPPQRLRRGMSIDEATRPTLELNRMLPRLLVWLHGRHSEHDIVGRVVDHVERELGKAGRLERPPDEPPAIAFVDLARYTELTQRGGDELAADFATRLQALAEIAARRGKGRVVKLLGDGVMLRYPSARAAVESVLSLIAAVASAGLPSAHAAVAAGPIVVREGDVYGHTVNLAARMAAHAKPGELLVTAGSAKTLADAGIALEDAGEATLKGIAEPVPLMRVVIHTA